MRIKILLLGNDPLSLVADAQLLRERGIMVFSTFNLENVNELIAEVKPDLVFFDAHRSSAMITDVYNTMVNGIKFTNIPVIFTLSEDDVYLITRKRTDTKEKRTIISDNMIDAIKLALRPGNSYHKKKPLNSHSGKNNNSPDLNNPDAQLRIPFYS
jgi:response regulator RpfG family c-di-GMP phosphodiesterase